MPTVTFKAKPEAIHNADNTLAYRRVKVPTLTRRHCDMHAFRSHPKFGPYANSELFANLLAKQLRDRAIGPYIRLDRLPACVSADLSGFLATITISLD